MQAYKGTTSTNKDSSPNEAKNDIKKVDGASGKSRYIQVTQDGVARLSSKSTPEDIDIGGLYTDKLETCIAILITGEKGITLIHNTGQLSYCSIKNEFMRIGKIAFWTMAYNPMYYPQGVMSESFKEATAYFISEMDKTDKILHNKLLKNPPGKDEERGNVKCYEAKEGYVSINRKAKISVTEKPLLLEPPYQVKLREAINEVNNYFLLPEEKIDADVQYDGSVCTNLPSFKKSRSEIISLKQHPKFSRSELLERMIAQYDKTSRMRNLLDTQAQEIAKKFIDSLDLEGTAKLLNQQAGYTNVVTQCPKIADAKQAIELLKSSKHEQALPIFLSYAKQKEDAGKEDVSLASCYHNIATCYRRLNNEEKDKEYSHKSAELKKRLSLENDGKTVNDNKDAPAERKSSAIVVTISADQDLLQNLARNANNLLQCSRYKNIDNTWAVSDGIHHFLDQALGNFVEVINPELSSRKSPGSNNDEEAFQGAVNYAKAINDILGGRGFNKPIVMVWNTQSAKMADAKDYKAIGGMHWQTCVVLPKTYTTPLGDTINNPTVRVLFIDSLNSNSSLPKLLEIFLKYGLDYSFKDANGGSIHYQVPALCANGEFVKNPNPNPQQKGGEDCGWWAVYNALMCVLTGKNDFLAQFKTAPSRDSAYVLRSLFPDLSKGIAGAKKASPSKPVNDEMSATEKAAIQKAIEESLKEAKAKSDEKKAIDGKSSGNDNKEGDSKDGFSLDGHVVNLSFASQAARSLTDAIPWRDIPKFAVITGVNGSGKTHLLSYIKAANDARRLGKSRVMLVEAYHAPNLNSFPVGSEAPSLFFAEVDKDSMPQVIKQIVKKIKNPQESLLELTIHMNGRTQKVNLNPVITKIRLMHPELEALPKAKLEEKIRELTKAREIDFGYLGAGGDDALYVLCSVFTAYQNNPHIFKEAPWITVDKILSNYGFKYRLEYKDSRLVFVERSTGQKRDVLDLSSGEYMLLHIISWRYCQQGLSDGSAAKNKIQKTQVILLDEPDKHLDPKLCKIFFDAIYRILVQEEGIQVIMTTHRVDTIALVPTDNIVTEGVGIARDHSRPTTGVYTIERDPKGQARIMPVTRLHAMFRLTHNLRGLTNLHFKVFTEAHNDMFLYEGVYRTLRQYSDSVRMENAATALGAKDYGSIRFWERLGGNRAVRLLSRRYQLSFQSTASDEKGGGGGVTGVESMLTRTIMVSLKRSETCRKTTSLTNSYVDPVLEAGYGVIDKDWSKGVLSSSDIRVKERVFCLNRYAIENYIFDPFIICSALDRVDVERIRGGVKDILLRFYDILHKKPEEIQAELDNYLKLLIESTLSKSARHAAMMKNATLHLFLDEVVAHFFTVFPNLQTNIDVNRLVREAINKAKKFKSLEGEAARDIDKAFNSVKGLVNEILCREFKLDYEANKAKLNSFTKWEKELLELETTQRIILDKKKVIEIKYRKIFFYMRGHNFEDFVFFDFADKKGGVKDEGDRIPFQDFLLQRIQVCDELCIPMDLANLFFTLNDKVRADANAVIKPAVKASRDDNKWLVPEWMGRVNTPGAQVSRRHEEANKFEEGVELRAHRFEEGGGLTFHTSPQDALREYHGGKLPPTPNQTVEDELLKQYANLLKKRDGKANPDAILVFNLKKKKGFTQAIVKHYSSTSLGNLPSTDEGESIKISIPVKILDQLKMMKHETQQLTRTM